MNPEKVIADYTANSSCPRSSYQENHNTNIKKFHKQNHENRKKSVKSLPPAGKERQSMSNQMTFLYENSRFINQPICFTNSRDTRKVQESWWPEQVSVEHKTKPTYTTSTTQRTDYAPQSSVSQSKQKTRFGATKHIKVDSILPKQNIADKSDTASFNSDINSQNCKEKISYKHNFDCRKERTERGKLHGSFVLEPFSNA